MYKVSVMYPNTEDGNFDYDYYVKKHMELVKEHLRPFGLVNTSVEKGISGGGDKSSPFVCIGCLYFKTEDGYDKGIAKTGTLLREDIANYTNITPIRQISKILE